MAAQQSGLDRLMEEINGYLAAHGGKLADKAGDSLTGLVEKIGDGGGGGGLGSMAGIGGRLLKGESPLKAIAGQKAKDLTGGVTEKAKSLFGGGGGGGDDGGSGGGGGG
ncbi:cyclase, partial [Streptomyces sp. SID8380]|nr:cyclase [Streptomyces sp. SID8380]